MFNVILSFWSGLTTPSGTTEKKHCRIEQKMRNKMSEDQLDRMLAETCDASDPISTY